MTALVDTIPVEEPERIKPTRTFSEMESEDVNIQVNVFGFTSTSVSAPPTKRTRTAKPKQPKQAPAKPELTFASNVTEDVRDATKIMTKKVRIDKLLLHIKAKLYEFHNMNKKLIGAANGTLKTFFEEKVEREGEQAKLPTLALVEHGQPCGVYQAKYTKTIPKLTEKTLEENVEAYFGTTNKGSRAKNKEDASGLAKYVMEQIKYGEVKLTPKLDKTNDLTDLFNDLSQIMGEDHTDVLSGSSTNADKTRQCIASLYKLGGTDNPDDDEENEDEENKEDDE